jgi:hypothetical protein
VTYRCLDSITVTDLLAGADAYLGYPDGDWPTFPALRARFPDAKLVCLVVSADADPDPDADAAGCDCENGDLTPEQVPGWVKRQRARDVWRPVAYCSASAAAGLLELLAQAGITRAQIRLLTAHYTHAPHICAPTVCGYPAADGTQWTDLAGGLNGSLIDESLLGDDFFSAAQPSGGDDEMLVNAALTPGQPVLLNWPEGHVTKLSLIATAATSIDVSWFHTSSGWYDVPTPAVIGAGGGEITVEAKAMGNVAGAQLTVHDGGAQAHARSWDT